MKDEKGDSEIVFVSYDLDLLPETPKTAATPSKQPTLVFGQSEISRASISVYPIEATSGLVNVHAGTDSLERTPGSVKGRRMFRAAMAP